MLELVPGRVECRALIRKRGGYSKGAHIPFFRENVVLKMTFFFVLKEQELQHLTRNLERVFQYLPKIGGVW